MAFTRGDRCADRSAQPSAQPCPLDSGDDVDCIDDESAVIDDSEAGQTAYQPKAKAAPSAPPGPSGM